MSKLVEHARRELEISGYLDTDADYDGKLGYATLEIIELIASQGHSGHSLTTILRLVPRLASFKPLSALTGESDEWDEVSHGLQQNNRCPSVIMYENKNVVDVNTKQWVKFPYFPE